MPTLILILLALAFLLADTAAASNLFRCTQSDGNEILTDHVAKEFHNCRKYDLKSPRNEMDKVQSAQEKPSAQAGETKYTVEPRLADPLVKGVIDFDTFKRLSVGMTEATVMNLAGPPKAKFIDTWVYMMQDNWTVELRFGGGPVILTEIRQYQATK